MMIMKNSSSCRFWRKLTFLFSNRKQCGMWFLLRKWNSSLLLSSIPGMPVHVGLHRRIEFLSSECSSTDISRLYHPETAIKFSANKPVEHYPVDWVDERMRRKLLWAMFAGVCYLYIYARKYVYYARTIHWFVPSDDHMRLIHTVKSWCTCPRRNDSTNARFCRLLFLVATLSLSDKRMFKLALIACWPMISYRWRTTENNVDFPLVSSWYRLSLRILSQCIGTCVSFWIRLCLDFHYLLAPIGTTSFYVGQKKIIVWSGMTKMFTFKRSLEVSMTEDDQQDRYSRVLNRWGTGRIFTSGSVRFENFSRSFYSPTQFILVLFAINYRS